MSMQAVLETIYGLGRLAFGAGLLAAPSKVGGLLLGEQPDSAARIALRSYGTRDVVLGLGLLQAVAGEGDTRPWLAASVASDALDTVVQLGEWSDLPPDRRLLGVLAALGAGGTGAVLLVRR